MQQHTQEHEHMTSRSRRTHLIYTRRKCASIQYTLTLSILRHACSKGFDLCWKEQFWLHAVSSELFVGDRPAGGASLCLKLYFPLGGHPTLTPIPDCFASYHSSNIYPAPPAGSMGQTVGILQRKKEHGSSSQGALILNLMENQNKWLWKGMHDSVLKNITVQTWCRGWKTRLRKTLQSLFFALTRPPHLTSDTTHVRFPHIKQSSDIRWVSHHTIQFWH